MILLMILILPGDQWLIFRLSRLVHLARGGNQQVKFRCGMILLRRFRFQLGQNCLQLADQPGGFDCPHVRGAGREFFYSGAQEAFGADKILAAQMIEGNSDLDEALKECFLLASGIQPGRFQSLMAFEILAAVEEITSLTEPLVLFSR